MAKRLHMKDTFISCTSTYIFIVHPLLTLLIEMYLCNDMGKCKAKSTAVSYKKNTQSQ